MSYQLKLDTALDFVAIKVKDIEAVISFYKSVLGLDLLREENGMAFIGIKEQKKSLICLVEDLEGLPSETNHNGLFYFGLQVPSRQALAEIYQHLLTIKYPIQTVSDLGFSEAIYLKDPEFNGIKVYWDKPQGEGKNRLTGTMDQIMQHLDTRELLAEAKEAFSHIPNDSRIGHVHLNVVDLDESQRFYESVLGLNLTSTAFPSLRYLAAGDNYQHITLNTFNHAEADDNRDENLGLDYIAFKVNTVEEIRALNQHLSQLDVEYFYNKGKKIIQVDDPNGIHVWFHLYDFKK